MKRILSFFTVIYVSMNIGAQRIINLNDENTDAGLRQRAVAVTEVIPQEFLIEAKDSRSFAINPALQNANGVSVGDIITLQLFEGKSYRAIVSNITTNVNGNFTLSLKLPDYPMAFGFITTNRAGRSLFFVSIPELNQKFSSRGNIHSQTDFLIELDETINKNLRNDEREIPTATPMNEGDDTDNQNSQVPQRSRDSAGAAMSCTPNPSLTGTDVATIDVLIVYTQAAKDWADTNDNGIENTIAGAMAQAVAVVGNQRNSDAIVNVHSALINYVEVQGDRMNTDLDRLTDSADGYMDEIHQLRKQYNADVVSLFEYHDANVICSDGKRDGTGGLGWVLSNATNGNYDRAFNVIRVQQASQTITMIHEIGHNMGMRHEKEQYATLPAVLFPYAWGWYWTGNDGYQYGSVMSYTGRESPYFSNPNETYMGQPTGDVAEANNAQVFRNTKHVVAFYSDKLNNLPDTPSNVVVSNPTPYGATVTWDAVPNASFYRLYFQCNDGWRYYDNITVLTRTFSVPTYLSPCSPYGVYVVAVNECGDVVRAATVPYSTSCPSVNCDVSAPINIVASNPTDYGATFSWDAVEGATEYRICTPTGPTTWYYWSTTVTSGTVSSSVRFAPCATYEIWIQVFNECGNDARSERITFTTKCATDPTVTTSAATGITYNSAKLNKSVTGTAITSQGFMYKEMSATTWQSSADGNLNGLEANTQYKFYAYATTVSNTFNGRVLTFTTAPHTPLATFKMKWSEAEITQPTAAANGKIYIASLNTDRKDCMEVYFTLSGEDYDDCQVFVDGQQLSSLTLDGQGVLSDYICFSTDIETGWTRELTIVRPTRTRSTETIATYDLVIGGISTDVNEITTEKVLKTKNCYTPTGIQVDCKSEGIVIKKKTFTDGSTEIIKELK